jgi:hypothetical protein
MPAGAEDLARTAATIVDADVRVAWVRSELRRMDAGELAELISIVVAYADARTPPYADLLLAISVALADASCDSLRAAVVAAAGARGYANVALLFERPGGEPGEPDQERMPDFGKGRPLTLGERKSLARRRDRNLIARVLRDPHHDVIRILLGNPALTEEDVVRLCARRPIAPEVLREVFASTRWIVRYHVRRALVLNPFTPPDVALQLAAHLTDQDARLVADSGELPEALRDTCRRRAPTIH